MLKKSDNNPVFNGCFVSKYDSRIVLMLEKGLVLFNSRTAEFCQNPESYVSAQTKAQKNQEGCWGKGLYIPAQPIAEVFEGVVLQVRCSNSIQVSVGAERKTVVFSSVKIPRFSSAVGVEPFGFEAREFLRKLLVGFEVTVYLDGAADDRLYGTVLLQNLLVNDLIIRQGLAEPCENCVGRNSPYYNQMQTSYEEAKKNKIGMYGVSTEAFQLFDTANLPEDSSHLNGYVGDGIIEQVSSGRRFHVLIPELKSIIRVGLNGLSSLSLQDRLGVEAKEFCTRYVLQRDVKIEILLSDRYNGLFSKINLIRFDGNQRIEGDDIAVLLFERGLAEIHHRVFKGLPEDYYQAQANAQSQKRGIWSELTRHEFSLTTGGPFYVKTVVVWDAITLTVQFNPETVVNISEDLKKAVNTLQHEPMANDPVIVRYKDDLYRAIVDRINPRDGMTNCRLLEYGQVVDVPWNTLYEMPDHLKLIYPMSKTVKLAFLEIEKEESNDLRFLWDKTDGKLMLLTLVKEEFPSSKVILSFEDPQTRNTVILNKLIKDNCSIRYSPIPDISPQLEQYVSLMSDEPT